MWNNLAKLILCVMLVHFMGCTSVKNEATLIKQWDKIFEAEQMLSNEIIDTSYVDGLPENAIVLKNSSFEGHPRLGTKDSVIKYWSNCGIKFFPKESPPDIHPVPESDFNVHKEAFHGETYLGLVVRDNKTWESISQKMSKPTQKDSCYSFSFTAAMDEYYSSANRFFPSRKFNYNDPIILRVWLGNTYCEKGQIIALTKPIAHTDWKPYHFDFQANANYKFIFIQAFYKDPSDRGKVRGNVLLDHMTPIIPIACE